MTRRRCCAWLSPGLLLAICSHAGAAAVPAATPPAAALAAAASALQNQDYHGAIRVLEPAMTGLQDNAGAWRSLGLAHLRLHEPRPAQEAYSKALSLQPGNALPLMYLGIAAAQLGQADVAFDWLRKAKDTRRVDMTQLDREPDLRDLRGDPRYADLLPRPEDFAHPFVEEVNIIREWDGESAGDQFGWIARVIGDVDGDGVNDFVTSAPTKNLGGADAGRIYVYSGRTGALLWSVDGLPGNQLGSGIEAAGDVNGDGIPDVIGSAPGIDTAYVYSGRDGHVLLTLHGETKGDSFGEHVASAGDIDGDGYSDVIIGAPANSGGGKGAGRAYVYSGKDGHLLLTLTGQRAGDALGSTVAGYSDAKHRFLVVGAPGAGAHRRGRVYVYKDLSAHPAFVIDPDPTGVALGYMFVSVLGDVDGDGVPDIFASDWSDASRGPGTGKTYVYSGRTGKRLYTFRGDTAGEGFGTTHSTAGDVNGDGRADIIVGSWQYGVAAPSGGRAYLFDGRTGGRLRTYTCKIVGDTFGFDAVGMGTLDDQGQSELLVTAGWSAVRGYHSGRIFLISSGVKRDVGAASGNR
jgi:FG-GAP repeat/FG-GAP-like repeat